MISRISSVLPPENIDYIVSNHSEMDHSGALPDMIARVKPEQVFASKMGADALEAHFHTGDPIAVVEDGETISLGTGSMTFYETRMLHWPDSMFTFFEPDGVLFSQDAFGMHFASAQRFADELDETVVEFEAAKYFANILVPYAMLAENLLERLRTLELPLRMIAPDHGPIFRKNLHWILDRYAEYAAQKSSMRVVIVYDTMWGSTDKMAQAVADGVVEAGGVPELFAMGQAHRSDVATALLRAGALIVGSPTINNTMFPTVADVLTYLRGLAFENLVGGAFGSYGWSGGAVKQVEEVLDAMGVERVADGVRVKYAPTNEDLVTCRKLGAAVAGRLTELCRND
jgi:flavorubredoxin